MPRSAQQIAEYEDRLARAAKMDAQGLDTPVIAARLGVRVPAANRLVKEARLRA